MLKKIVIVDNSKENHVCDHERNYIITKQFSFDDVNDTFLLNRLWPCFLCLNGVSDVRPIVKKNELLCYMIYDIDKWNFFDK